MLSARAYWIVSYALFLVPLWLFWLSRSQKVICSAKILSKNLDKEFSVELEVVDIKNSKISDKIKRDIDHYKGQMSCDKSWLLNQKIDDKIEIIVDHFTFLGKVEISFKLRKT